MPRLTCTTSLFIDFNVAVCTAVDTKKSFRFYQCVVGLIHVSKTETRHIYIYILDGEQYVIIADCGIVFNS